MRRLRFAVQPGWLALHAVTVALVVTMIFLGRWQLTVSEDKGFSIQNFGYALQWWAFSIFAVLMWARAMRDAYRKDNGAHHDSAVPHDNTAPEPAAATEAGTSSLADPAPIAIERPEPVAYRRYVIPATTQPNDDPLHVAYNDYLAQLAAADASTEELR